VGLTDSDIRQWSTDRSIARIIAADLASSINMGLLTRWNDLPDNARLADEYGTSARTAGRAKRLLADHGLLIKAGGRYYVA
jgi:DNA-binding GntR family transcriptional regulator